MKCVRMVGLLVVASLASTAFAVAASADEITSPTDTVHTGTIHAESEDHAVLHVPIAKIECFSTLLSQVENHETGLPAEGSVLLLPFTGCTNSWHVTVESFGALDVHGTVNYDGELTSTGLTIDVTRFGVTCVYVTNNTRIGEVTGGSPATLHINAKLPKHSGSSALCGTGAATWTGSYQVDEPSSLYVDGHS